MERLFGRIDDVNTTTTHRDIVVRGVIKMPVGTHITESDIDPNIVKQVDPVDRGIVFEAMNYVAYTIIKDGKDVEIEIITQHDEHRPENIFYQLCVTFPGDGVIITSTHIDQLRQNPFMRRRSRVSHEVQWYADFDRRRICLNVPIDSMLNKTRMGRVDVTRMSFYPYEHVPIFDYESEDQRGTAKRKRLDKV